MNILDEIVENKKKELSSIKENLPLEKMASSARRRKDFKASIERRMSLIAEIKMRSPSKGSISEAEPMELLKEYEVGGASAISVVTDSKFFGGSVGLLNTVTKSTKLPVLRKDFIIEEYQIHESVHYGAGAILLIARIVSREQLNRFVELAKSVGLDTIVEVHDEEDLRKALNSGTEIVGINNRNLDDFTVDIETTNKLAASIPDDIVVVSESGIKSRDDVLSLDRRVNAILVGTSLIKSEDVKAKIMELIGNG